MTSGQVVSDPGDANREDQAPFLSYAYYTAKQIVMLLIKCSAFCFSNHFIFRLNALFIIDWSFMTIVLNIIFP